MAGSRVKQLKYSLESIAIFRGLPSDTLERIQRCCSWRRYEPRESIIAHLDTSDDVFFMMAGSARVTIRSVDGKAG
jgi:CRP/FNR family cyclic AMP-dependent transcriptional regulator